MTARLAAVFYPLGNGEHVVVVDRDGAGEDQAGAVVPAQRHRMFGGEFVTVGRPSRLRSGNRDAAADGDPARFGEIGVGRAGQAKTARSPGCSDRGSRGSCAASRRRFGRRQARSSRGCCGVLMCTRGAFARSSARTCGGSEPATVPGIAAPGAEVVGTGRRGGSPARRGNCRVSGLPLRERPAPAGAGDPGAGGGVVSACGAGCGGC